MLYVDHDISLMNLLQTERFLPSSSEVTTLEMLRGEHGGEQREYFIMENDLALSGRVPSVLQVRIEKVLDLEEDLVQDCYEIGI